MTVRSPAGLHFRLRPETFCIYRLPPDQWLDPARLAAAAWYSLTRTEDELSVVVPAGIGIDAADRQPGWRCLQIAGVLDFSTVGILAGISRLLAGSGVSIFAVSSYNTDHILVRAEATETALRALTAAGHTVESS